MVRRRREWQDVSIQESTSAGSQSNQTLTLGAGIDQKGLTMTRLILGLSVGADVLVANSVEISYELAQQHGSSATQNTSSYRFRPAANTASATTSV